MKKIPYNPYVNNGGAREGSGKKPISEDGAMHTVVHIRMLESQKQKMLELGGSAWVRDKIDKAKLPVKMS